MLLLSPPSDFKACLFVTLATAEMKAREEISLQWVDGDRQLYVSLLSRMRWLQRKIQMIYCTPSQTTLTLKIKKKFKKERPTSGCFSSIRRFLFFMKWGDSSQVGLIYIFAYFKSAVFQWWEDFRLKFPLIKRDTFFSLLSKEAVCSPPACPSLLALKPCWRAWN